MASSSSTRELGGVDQEHSQAVQSQADPVESTFDESVYLDFVRNAKRRLVTPAKKMPWEIRLDLPKVFHEMPKPSISFSKQEFDQWRATGQPVDKPAKDELVYFPMPKMSKKTPKISWEARLNSQRAASIAKWKTIVKVSLTSFQMGIQIANEPDTDIGDVLDDILAAKATSTMHARADAIIRFISWSRINGHIPIPFSETVVYAFLNDVGARSAPTFPRSFCCALAFIGHVLGCPSALECVASRRIIGHAAKCYKEKRMLIQKPPIKVEHVKILEMILQGVPVLKSHDRVAAGFFLWMIYARARFSDAQAASTIVKDVIDTDHGQDGFVEALVHRSKTSITLERKTRYLPMTAPIVGVSDRNFPWALAWLDAMAESELPLGKGKPLLPSQTDSGWSSLPIPAHVAAIWLKNLLKAGGALSEDIMAYGTHSCKATVLSWAAKYGLDAGTRARLGYHSRGAGGTELIYARDSMSQPLREMNAVLDEVRNGTFRPDATRSGYFTNPARAQQEVEQALSSSSEGSEDEEDPEHEQYERAQDHIMEPFCGNIDLDKLSGLVYFRHPASRVIHVVSDESGLNFKCGREIGRAYINLGGRPKILHPTCKQCFNRSFMKER